MSPSAGSAAGEGLGVYRGHTDHTCQDGLRAATALRTAAARAEDQQGPSHRAGERVHCFLVSGVGGFEQSFSLHGLPRGPLGALLCGLGPLKGRQEHRTSSRSWDLTCTFSMTSKQPMEPTPILSSFFDEDPYS